MNETRLLVLVTNNIPPTYYLPPKYGCDEVIPIRAASAPGLCVRPSNSRLSLRFHILYGISHIQVKY